MRSPFILPMIVMLSAGCGTLGENEVESEEAGLAIAYVSGHLGSEDACPVLTAELRRGVCLSPCDEAEPSPCANGAVLLRIQNIVDHTVPVRLERIELILDGSEELAIREIATTDGQRFSELGAAQNVTVRVLFPEVQNFGSDRTGKLRLIFSGEDGEKLELVTPELALIPAVVT